MEGYTVADRERIKFWSTVRIREEVQDLTRCFRATGVEEYRAKAQALEGILADRIRAAAVVENLVEGGWSREEAERMAPGEVERRRAAGVLM